MRLVPEVTTELSFQGKWGPILSSMCSVNSDNTICSWGRWPLLGERGPRLGLSALMDNDKTQTKQRKSSMSHSDLIFVKCLGNSLYSLSTIQPNMNTINVLSFTGTSPFSENLQKCFLFLQEGLNLVVINCRSCSQQGLYKNMGKICLWKIYMDLFSAPHSSSMSS